MKKVLLTITKSNFGGAQRYVFDLATTLSKQEFDVSVVLGGTGAAHAASGTLEEKLHDARIPTFFVQAFMRDISLRQEWRALRELVTLYRKEKPDIVHLNSSKAGGLGALAARIARVPRIVFTVHGLPQDEDRSVLTRMLIALATWASFLLSHRVIAISQNNFKRIQKFPFCRHKVHLVHNGIAPAHALEQTEARNALEIPSGITVIGTLGELTWNKNYPVLIRAAGILKREGKEFLVCIIGDGEEAAFLQTLAEEVGVAEHIRFLGFVPDARKYMQAFDLFVLPSLKEGLPYVLLEAGAAKLPVVGSRIPGIEEVITHKETGLLFDVHNERTLADALTLMCDDIFLRDTVSTALQKKVQNEFSLARMAEKTAKIYTH